MKSSFCLPVYLAATIVFFSACQKKITSPPVQAIAQSDDDMANSPVIYRFSFETKTNDTSFKEWTSSAGHYFSKDVPPNSGAWSLQLQPGYIPQQSVAEHRIILDTGKYKLKFSCYTKISSYGSSTGTGTIRLIKQSLNSTGGRVLAEKSFTNHTWEINHVTSGVHIEKGDIIIIQLSAGTAELLAWQTLFDCIRLEKVIASHT